MELFWLHGYHNLGVDKICRETGMTKGAFYNAFKGKEQFLLKALESYGDLIEAHLQNQMSKNGSSAFDRLTTLYKDMLKAQPDNGFRGCLVNNTMSEIGALNVQVANVTAHQFQRFIDAIQPAVREAQQDGSFDSNIDSRKLSEIIHTAFFGFLTRAKGLNSPIHDLIVLFLNSLKQKT